MTVRKRRQPRPAGLPLPLMVGEMALASFETIARRTALILQGRCSAAEYQRMVQEKVAAAQRSASVLAGPPGKGKARAALAPWHHRVVANAKRLRRR